jgi:hypothetical protein
LPTVVVVLRKRKVKRNAIWTMPKDVLRAFLPVKVLAMCVRFAERLQTVRGNR